MQLERQIDQKLDEHGETARKDERPAIDVEPSAVQIPRQHNDRRDQQPDRARDREGEGEEPVPASGKIEIEQVQPNGRKVDRDEDDRVRMAEPERQDDHDIEQPDRARRVARPDDRPVDAPVAEQGEDRGQKRHDRQHKQDAGAVDVLPPDTAIRRIGRLGQIARQIRVKYRRPAERTALFAVGQLHAAFDTIHNFCFLSHRRWLLSTFTGRPSRCSTR